MVALLKQQNHLKQNLQITLKIDQKIVIVTVMHLNCQKLQIQVIIL